MSRRLIAIELLAAMCAQSALFSSQALAQSLQLEDFESGLRIVQPSATTPDTEYLWSQYPSDFYAGPDPGLATITTDQAYSGTHSLQVVVTGGNIYMQFYPMTGMDWNFMHQYVTPSSAWTPDKYNAIRFWIKVPPQMIPETGGEENVQIGTYVRAQNGDPTTQGEHFYHFYNFKYTGEWEQVILDSHPSYMCCSDPGSKEYGDIPYPFGPGWTYIDALTRFYFDGQGGLQSHPATFYFDDFELFTRPPNENIDQVYDMHAVYVHATNEIDVGWARRKDQDTLTYEVRYSFQDINTTGWNAATPAPNGIIPGDGTGPYNLMAYSTTGINVTGHNVVYVAIKPQTATLFREIAIPITNVPPPDAPTGTQAK